MNPRVRYNHPWKKNNNKHASVIFSSGKNANFHILCVGAWNIYTRVLWYSESDGMSLIKISWLLGGVSPLFSKIRKFSHGRNYWWIILNLIFGIKQFVVTNCSKERPGSIVTETLKNGILIPIVIDINSYTKRIAFLRWF